MKLISLINESPSMNDDEKQYWKTLLPTMKQDQCDRLEWILQREKDKLAELDARFNIKE